MKIKVIDKDVDKMDNFEFENEINEFIKNKKVIDIKYNTQIIYKDFFETFEKNVFEIDGCELKSVLIMYDD